MRVKISRKEAKESVYWLRLINAHVEDNNVEGEKLYTEAIELKKIFSAIIVKSE